MSECKVNTAALQCRFVGYGSMFLDDLNVTQQSNLCIFRLKVTRAVMRVGYYRKGGRISCK